MDPYGYVGFIEGGKLTNQGLDWPTPSGTFQLSPVMRFYKSYVRVCASGVV